MCFLGFRRPYRLALPDSPYWNKKHHGLGWYRRPQRPIPQSHPLRRAAFPAANGIRCGRSRAILAETAIA
jgi:hypothetical protein